jgi:hypothetical protein
VIYYTVRIEITGFGKKKRWVAGFDKSSKVDREDEKTVPSALGYYHYPETMSDKKAFNTLIAGMVKRHRDEIRRLQKSMDKLKALKL